MEILRAEDGLTHAMRRMNAYGVLGAYIPDFGVIVGQMQHDLFHVYTVDAHTLMVLRNLRRLALGDDAEELALATRIMKSLVKPERIYLAALFHDIAKGRGGDHSELGAKDVMTFCRQHNLSEYDSKLTSWLVKNHLLMSFIAQRRDITDPEVVAGFARDVGDQEHLDNLYLLTLSDIRGTSPQVWNAWKGQLLLELYTATSRALRAGIGVPIDLERRIEDSQASALDLIDTDRTSPDQVQLFWDSLDKDYFTRYAPDYLAWHVDMIAQQSVLDMPMVAVRYHEQLGANIFLIYAPETRNLLVDVSGGFARCKLNIVDARLHSTRLGFGLYSFVALGTEHEAKGNPRHLENLRKKLRQVISSPVECISNIPTSRTLKHFPIEAKVTFTHNNPAYTSMEVVAQDQPGLLHKVAKCLLDHRVRMINARIATFGERAEDVFYITEHDGSPLIAEKSLKQLSKDVCDALNTQTD